jgi:hypothetical protein
MADGFNWHRGGTMARPAFLTIKRFVCNATNDFTGSDDVVGVMGPARFTIGSFAAGDDIPLEINQVVPVGESALRIVETDLVGDDDIGSIDLKVDMDVDTTANVQGQDANYDITYLVVSASDDSQSETESTEPVVG